MKNPIVWLAACLLASSCSSTPSALPIDSVPSPHDTWFFQQLTAEQTGNTVLVRGYLKPGAGASPALSGHVDIAIRDAQGNLLADTTADYFPRDTRRARLNNGALFEKRVPVVAGANLTGSVVRVAFHRHEPQSANTPVHSQNIAR